MGKLVRSCPSVLGCSLQGKLKPVAFLGTVVGAANVGALVRAQPSAPQVHAHGHRRAVKRPGGYGLG